VELRGDQPLPELQYTFQTRRDDHRALLMRLRELVGDTVDFDKPGPLWGPEGDGHGR
jgi:hypothetical protein